MAGDAGDPRYKQFERWDKDQSGFVDAGELEKVLEAIYEAGLKSGKTAADAGPDAKKMISSMDQNKDGKVSWEEFKKALES